MPLNDREVGELRATAEVLLSPFSHPTIEAWQGATLGAIAELLGAPRGTILTTTGTDGQALAYKGVDESQLMEYQRDWLEVDLNEEAADGNEFLRRGLCSFTQDLLWHGPNADRQQLARYARSPIWNDYYLKYGVTDGGGYAVLVPQPEGPALLLDYLFVYDDDPSNPRLRDEGLRLLKVLEPAFRAGSQMARMRGQLQQPLLACIDALPGAVALLTHAGRYAHKNPDWRLRLASGPHASDVERLATRMAQGVAGSRPTPTKRRRPMVPARVSCGAWLLTATRFDIPGHPEPFALVHADPQAPVRTDWHARAVDAGLSPRLAEVAALIAEGRSNQEIATMVRISPSTARRHTERVLARLGVERRSAVAAVLDATRTSDA